jgi:predicted nucleic-acid-binding Zn-ribbon protein
MLKSKRCPKCQWRKIWALAPRAHNGVGGWNFLAAGVNPGFVAKPIGQMQACICQRCGYTEWWTAGIEELTEDRANGIFLLDGEGKMEGPYR